MNPYRLQPIFWYFYRKLRSQLICEISIIHLIIIKLINYERVNDLHPRSLFTYIKLNKYNSSSTFRSSLCTVMMKDIWIPALTWQRGNLTLHSQSWANWPRVRVQLQQSCCWAAVPCSSSSSSWRQQSRQRPPASKMAWVGHRVQLAGPGPRHSRQELSQSSQVWLEPWWWMGESEEAPSSDTQQLQQFHTTIADSLLLKTQNVYL